MSAETVRRVLKQSGFKAVTKKKKPQLKARHKKARYEFAMKYKEWTVQDWFNVYFSDEVKINRFGSDGHEFVWKRKNEPLSERLIQGTVKFGGGNIMVWGCISGNGVGNLVKIEGKMNAKDYCKVLEEGLLGTLRKQERNVKRIIFQHDNDPKHRSKTATGWLKMKKIKVLEWPSMSPDLNPIENMLKMLKMELNKYNTEANGVAELWQRSQDVWESFPKKKCQELLESMPRRIEAVIKSKGSYTKY